jgi:hypothetical protein
MNEYHNYLLKFEEAKMRLSINLNKSIYQRLILHVTFHVLKVIDEKCKLLICQSIAFSACTNVFIIITNCLAIIEFRIDSLMKNF